MSPSALFVVLVVISFALWMAASYGGSPWAERAARTGFFLAALVWALGGR